MSPMQTRDRCPACSKGRGHACRQFARRTVVQVVLALVLVFGTTFAVAGCTVQVGDGGIHGSGDESPSITTQATVTTAAPTSGGSSATTAPKYEGPVSPAQKAATVLAPSVVNIKVSGTSSGGLFGQQQFSAQGSGVIYASNGTIVTNNHVVTDEYGEPVTTIEVTLTTGEKLPATILGRDVITDLAVIKVAASVELPAAAFQTELPQVGEYSVAIGSPLGFQNSVTLGIVSALNRSIDIQTRTGQVMTYTSLIQTDTAISPGNSGGALGNAAGQVIGINQAAAGGGEAENIGFAIPSPIVTKVVDDIIRTGHATHAFMGVTPQTVTPELQRQFALSRSSGALVAELALGGPAAKAGLQQGDIIIKVDGHDINEASDLLGAIRGSRPGDTVTVTVDRSGATREFPLTLSERPSDL